MIIGSKEWLVLQRTGIFDRRPPVVDNPRPATPPEWSPSFGPIGNRPNRGMGKICAYCKRPLEDVRSNSRRAATRDHVIPRSKGGSKVVWACRQCNSIKGAMLPDEWETFMKANHCWWQMPAYQKHGTAYRRITNRREWRISDAALR